MRRQLLARVFVTIFLGLAVLAQTGPKPIEGDVVVHNFRFQSGEVLPDLRLHYATLGKPRKDSSGQVTNAVLVLHGTGGSWQQFAGAGFARVLFDDGELLDASRYFVVIPDSVGHGHSSKPSDGLHARFPHYDYDDMVAAQHELLVEGLGVNHLRLVMGTSMGCMHSFVWMEKYPDFMDAGLPLACLPVQIAGRNRMMRTMIMDSIRNDPDWHGGEYASQPRGLQAALYTLLIMGSSPLQMQKQYPTRDQADKFLHDFVANRTASTDANDLLYQVDASRNYDPSPGLGQIKAVVTHLNSADDLINPPELGIAEREIKKIKNGTFILLPITDQTRGHGTHTLPAIWKNHLEELLKASEHRSSN